MHQYTQTKQKYFSNSEPYKVSPIKFENNENFFTDPDEIFENYQESENLTKNVNLQSERLAKLHKQISETMQTNQIILNSSLKAEHSRSKSEFFPQSKSVNKNL